MGATMKPYKITAIAVVIVLLNTGVGLCLPKICWNGMRALFARKDYGKAVLLLTGCIKTGKVERGWLSTIYNNRGIAFLKKRQFQRAIDDFKRAIKLGDPHGRAHNNLAWIRCTCPDSRFRDGKQAVVLAKKAVSLRRDDAHLNTLAAAYAELGNFNVAVKIETLALSMLPAGKTFDPNRRLIMKRIKLYKSKKPCRDNN
jgi:tetratricopeptide (TPR) repeat protein